MRRIVLLCALFICSFHYAFSQSSLKFRVAGNDSTSKHFVQFNEQEKILFNYKNPAAQFGLNKNCGLALQSKETDKLGFTHYRYIQTYFGIPVAHSMFIVHVRNGYLTGTSGSIITEFAGKIISANATLSSPAALQKAIANVHANLYAWQSSAMESRIKAELKNTKATYYPKPVLVWFAGKEKLALSELKLCYKVDVYALKPLSRADYFVDANTGKIVAADDKLFFSDTVNTVNTYWSGAQNIHADFTGTNFRLRDYTKGSGIITLHGEYNTRGNDYTSTSNTWPLNGNNIAALDAHFGVSSTYNFYMANFGRNSYDNAGTALYSYVNDPTYIDNAFWDGTAMNYNVRSTGEAGGVTGIDVTGHELTHGVTQATCGLVYSYESGAMNESLSDIMGKSVQFFTKPTDTSWRMSNDMNWIIRNMANPNEQNQPDTYLGNLWYTGYYDNGGVHYNSGVGNYMFYLLVQGGSGINDFGNPYAVQPIGLYEADQIIYRSQTVYLFSSAQYADWRTACINAASDLYGASSFEVKQVENAFYAVGIGTPGTDCAIPKNLVATNITYNSASLLWDTVEQVQTFNLAWKNADSSNWILVPSLIQHNYDLSGLSIGTNYQFKVESNCSTGTTSGFSAADTFHTIYACGIPDGLAAENIDPVTVAIAWNAVPGSKNYNIQYRKLGAPKWTNISTTGNADTLYNLSPGTQYEYQIQAKCKLGWGPYSVAQQFFTLSACDVTTGLYVNSTAPTSASVSWDAVSFAYKYKVQYRVYNTTKWASDTSATNTLQLNNLKPSSTYEFQVQATCPLGAGAYSYSNYFTTLDACGFPATLKADSVTITSMVIKWKNVNNASVYRLQYRMYGKTKWIKSPVTNNLSYRMDSLLENTQYEVQVQAQCPLGWGPYSYSYYFTTAAKCYPPAAVTLNNLTNSSAKLLVDAVYTATNYKLQYHDINNPQWDSTTSKNGTFSLSGLQQSTAYEYKVNALCPSGESDYTTPALFITKPNVCTDNFEPNDQKNAATNINVNTVISANIHKKGNGDYYKFVLPSQTTVHFLLTNLVKSDALKLLSDSAVLVVVSDKTTNDRIYDTTLNPGNYYIEVYSPQEQIDTTNCYALIVQTKTAGSLHFSNISGITNKVTQNQHTQFVLQPNPSKGFLNISAYCGKYAPAIINIYSSQGTKIFTQKIYTTKGINSFNINLPKATSGLYIAQIVYQGTEQKINFVLQR